MPRGRLPTYTANPYIMLDPEDMHLLELSWKFLRTKYNVYASRTLPDGKTELLHRRVMNCPPGMVVDHLNEDGLDCRRGNLKVVTQRKNLLRAHPTGGVYKVGNRWKVQMGNKHLGMFATAGEAIEARRLAREKALG